jgi:hypothetical protein
MRLVLNKAVLLLAIPLLLVSCKAKKALPEGAPAEIKQKELINRVAEGEGTFDNIRIRASGALTADGNSQSFRVEVRIVKDSLIWVELADPVLGLKLARAIITPDSIFMINRIDREYFKGDISELQNQFGVSYGFRELQRVLSGNLVFEIDRSFELYYVPGSYLLSNVNPLLLTDSSEQQLEDAALQAYINPSQFKPSRQVQYDPETDLTYSLYYHGFKDVGNGFYYPDIIELEYGDKAENKLRLVIRRFEQNDPELRFPFNIPSQYAEMR